MLGGFVDTKGSTGFGSLVGPVERINSAMSRVDSVFILDSRARRPPRIEESGSEVSVFNGFDKV